MISKDEAFALLLAGLNTEKSAELINEQINDPSFKKSLESLMVNINFDSSNTKVLQDFLKGTAVDLQKLKIDFNEVYKQYLAFNTKAPIEEAIHTLQDFQKLFKESFSNVQGAEIKIATIDIDTGNVEKVLIKWKDVNDIVNEAKVTYAELADMDFSKIQKSSLDKQIKAFGDSITGTVSKLKTLERESFKTGDLTAVKESQDLLVNKYEQNLKNVTEQIAKERELGLISKEKASEYKKTLIDIEKEYEEAKRLNSARLEGIQRYQDMNRKAKEYTKIMEGIYFLEHKEKLQGELDTYDSIRLESFKEEKKELDEIFIKHRKIGILRRDLQAQAKENVEAKIIAADAKAIDEKIVKIEKAQQAMIGLQTQLKNLKSTESHSKEDTKELEEQIKLQDKIIDNYVKEAKGLKVKGDASKVLNQKIKQTTIERGNIEEEVEKRHTVFLEEKEQALKKVVQANTNLKASMESLPELKTATGIDDKNFDEFIKKTFGAKAALKSLGDVTEDQYGHASRKFVVTLDKTTRQLQHQELALNLVNGEMQVLSGHTTQNTNKMEGFALKISHAAEKMAIWGIAAKVLYGTMRQLRQGLTFVEELDKDLTQVAIVTGQTREQVKYLAGEYAVLGKELGKTVKEISQVNTELVRQGLTVAESTARMQTILKLSAAGSVNYADSLKIVTAAVNAMHVEHEKAANVLLKVSTLSASSVEELGEAFTKTASSAEAAGMSIEQTTAFLATMLEVTQEGASALGTSLKTILARMQRVDEETGEVNEELNKIHTAMESVGVSFLDANGYIKGSFEILTDLAHIWGTLDKNQKAYIATTTAGVRSQNRFFAIMNNFERVEQLTQSAAESGGMLERSFITYTDSVEAANNRLKVSFEQLWINTIKADDLILLKDFAESIVGLINKIGGLNVAITVLGLGFAKKFGLLKLLKEANVDLVLAIGKVIKSEYLLNMERYQSLFLLEGVNLQTKIAIGLNSVFNKTTGAVVLNLLKQNAVLIGVTVAVVALVKAYSYFKKKQEEVKKEMIELNNKTVEYVQNQNYQTKRVEELGVRYQELSQKVRQAGTDMRSALTTEEFEEFNRIHKELLEIMPDLKTETDRFGNSFITMTEGVAGLNKEYENFVENLKEKHLKNLPKILKDTEKELNKVTERLKFLSTMETIFGETEPRNIEIEEKEQRKLELLQEYIDKSRVHTQVENEIIDTMIHSEEVAVALYNRGIRGVHGYINAINDIGKALTQAFKDDSDEGLGAEIRAIDEFAKITSEFDKQILAGAINFKEYNEGIEEQISLLTELLDKKEEQLEVDIEKKELSEREIAENRTLIDIGREKIALKKNELITEENLLEKQREAAAASARMTVERLEHMKKTKDFLEKVKDGYLDTVDGQIELLKLYPELIDKEMSKAEKIAYVQEMHEEAVEAYKKGEAEKIIATKSFFEKLEEDYPEFYQELFELYGDDLKNFKDLTEVKEKLNKIMIGGMARDLSEFYSAELGVYTSTFGELNAFEKSAIFIMVEKRKKAIADLEDLQERLKGSIEIPSFSDSKGSKSQKELLSLLEAEIRAIQAKSDLSRENLALAEEELELLQQRTDETDKTEEYYSQEYQLVKKISEANQQLIQDLEIQKQLFQERADAIQDANSKYDTEEWFDTNFEETEKYIRLKNNLISKGREKELKAVEQIFDELKKIKQAWKDTGDEIKQATNRAEELRREMERVTEEARNMVKDAFFDEVRDRIKELQRERKEIVDEYKNEVKELKKEIKDYKNIREKEIDNAGTLFDIEKNITNARIDALQAEIDAKKAIQDIDKEDEERAKKLLEIEELRLKLENIRQQKNIQLLTQLEDGTFDYIYTYDESEAANTEKTLQDKIEDFNKWELDLIEKKNLKRLEDELKTLKAELKAREDAHKATMDMIKEEIKAYEELRQAKIEQIEEDIEKEEDSFDLRIRNLEEFLGLSENEDKKRYTGEINWMRRLINDIENMESKSYDRRLIEMGRFYSEMMAKLNGIIAAMQMAEMSVGTVNTSAPVLQTPIPQGAPVSATGEPITGAYFTTPDGKKYPVTIIDGTAFYNSIPVREYFKNIGGYVTTTSGATYPIDKMHEGGIVGNSAPSDFPNLVNKLFNTAPNEQIIKALKGELLVPQKNIFENFVPNMRNLLSGVGETTSQIFNISKLEFPNVRDAKEIERAISNLSIYAPQWAGQR